MSLLESDAARGLTNEQVALRYAELGRNELVDTGGREPWGVLCEQLSGSLVVLLIVAVGVSAFLHEYTDTVVILAIVVLNAVFGFVQDYRAGRALAALKKLAISLVRVRREGEVREISARELVRGDVVLMEVGTESLIADAVSLCRRVAFRFRRIRLNVRISDSSPG